ncbi:MAG: DUF2510 domain-containing protein [Acidimicrobiales bacterium]
MLIIFGIRRLNKRMGPIALRCSNCGMSGLALFRVSTWFALFFIPVIPLGFKHVTVCPNCKRQAQVSKETVDAAREHSESPRGPGPAGAEQTQGATLEASVNQWAGGAGPAGLASDSVPLPSAQPAAAAASPAPQVPPGWFPDHAAGLQRYWDGQQWTNHTAPLN